MWVMSSLDRMELEAYRALGSVEELRALKARPYPDDEDLAPLPWADHDPAQEAAEGYGDSWDYPTDEQQRRHSGLLEDEA